MDQPNTVLATIKRIRSFAEAMKWSRSRLAVEAGMRDTVLRHFDRPDWNPTADTLRRLEALIPADWQAGDPAPTSKRAA